MASFRQRDSEPNWGMVGVIAGVVGVGVAILFGLISFTGQIASREWRVYFGFEKAIPNKPPEDEIKVFHPPGEKVDQVPAPHPDTCSGLVSVSGYGCEYNLLFWIERVNTTAEETTISLAVKRVQQDSEKNKPDCNLSANSQQFNDKKDIPIYFTDDTGNSYNLTEVYFTDGKYYKEINYNGKPYTVSESYDGVEIYGVKTIRDEIKNIKPDEIIRTTLKFSPLKYNTSFVVFHSPWIERCQLSLQTLEKN